MKKLTKTLAIMALSLFAVATPRTFAQTMVPVTRDAQSYYYLEISETTLGVLKSAIAIKKSVSINFGKDAPTASAYKITDEKETGLVTFENVIGALNYLGAQGWEVVSTYKRDTGNSGLVYYLLKYDAAKHPATAITRAIDDMLANLPLQEVTK